jgi:hypothetical protein
MISRQGLEALSGRKVGEVTIDIDTTVLPLFGNQEYAVPGPNPKYKGRPSYHPILARIAETGTVLGARLRPGDTSLGELDTEDLEQWIDRLRETVGDDTVITARIDAGGDSSAILRALHDKGVHFVVKAKQTANLLTAAMLKKNWRTVDEDAFGEPTRQVAELEFQRAGWPEGTYRVIAARTTERLRCRQTCLWEGLDWSVQFYVTNDLYDDIDTLALSYDARAGVEPLIGELKGSFGIGKVPTASFEANEGFFLIKLLAYNLMKRWVMARLAAVACWSMPWVRRVLVYVPARLLRAGGRWELRLAPRPLLH